MYTVSVKKKIDIVADDAGNFVAEVIKNDFDSLAKSVSGMYNSLHTLKPYEREDLLNDMEVLDAMKVMLRYYMVHDDYSTFMELQRCLGNVR